MRYRVRHVSTLEYAVAVERARFNLRLKPRLRVGQVIESETLTLSPKPAARDHEPGPYWVNTTQALYTAPLKKLEVASEFVIDIAPPNPPESGPTISALRSQALAAKDLSDLSPAPYVFASRLATASPAIAAWGFEHLKSHENAVEAISNLTKAIFEEFTYAPGKTDSQTPPDEAFEARHGVCQDFTHVMIIALRAAGIPTAYVSGYLLTRPPPGKEKLVGADAMHAWVAAWCGDDLGWIGFDPTNNCLAAEDHIPIAMGRDFADVSPIDGTFIGSAPQSMKSAVDVERLD
ncbi:MAG: transglutaminase family protein [Pseudomonadota bacterium]